MSGEQTEMSNEAMIIWPPEYVGKVDVSQGRLTIGDLEVFDVGSGYPDAAVYVQRVSGKTEGFVVGKIIIEIIGDGVAQEELDAQNDEAELHPFGPKAYWMAKGMTETEWDEGFFG